jgi:hypothetical protein
MPYYEEVGDQDTSGREMLHYTDTFTVDGEKWNKYDFFDSDGLEKSIGGIAAKTAVTLIPYMIPYVREFWGAVNVSKELSKLLPVLGKAFNGIFNGDPESDLIKDLNKLENYVSRFDASTSDEGMKQYFGLETVGNLLSSVGSQLFQQRVISMIPTILGDPAKAGVNAKLGQELALAYMAGTSSTETYSSFIDVIGDWIVYMDKNQVRGTIGLVRNDGKETIEIYSIDYTKISKTEDEEIGEEVITP